MEEKTQEMAKLGSDLLLCRSDELDLIEGEASAERQLRFMEQLLDVIRYLDAITGTDTGDSTTSSREESLRGAARKNEEFLREVFSSPSLPALLAPTLPPCTADIKPLLLEELAPHMRSRLSGRSSGKTLAELSSTLEEANAALERLSAEVCLLGGSRDFWGNRTSGNRVRSLCTLELLPAGGHGAPGPWHCPADPGAGSLRLTPADGGLQASVRDRAAGTLRPWPRPTAQPLWSPGPAPAPGPHPLHPGAAGAGPAERHLRAGGADGGAETRRARHQPPSDTACEDGGAASALPGPPGRCRWAAGVTPGLGWGRGEGWGAPGPPSHKGAAVPLFLG
ncbi:uncharacterized protein LOC127036435 isoform X1 [Gopherus flavomarginatus]|uniref:uncharacterized protein LOC127036435 isoform X1 n=2 Tax=Gopherus flavomarginatus TaxID=286002 RepID=UPI0021CBC795|nr:uncharacterized protein LOC127036435 isoform X1 [Gopherus flavomarginatus]